jgi:hypothetical protein
MESYLKFTYERYRKPSSKHGEEHQRLLYDTGASPISGLGDKPCGYNQGMTRINSGYRCATASLRVILTSSSLNGLMSRGFQAYPKKYRDKQQKKGLHRWKHSLHKYQYSRNVEWAKPCRLRQMMAQRN